MGVITAGRKMLCAAAVLTAMATGVLAQERFPEMRCGSAVIMAESLTTNGWSVHGTGTTQAQDTVTIFVRPNGRWVVMLTFSTWFYEVPPGGACLTYAGVDWQFLPPKGGL